MKAILVLAALVSTSAFAGALPEKLVCNGTKFLAGDSNFNDPSVYFPATIGPGLATVDMSGPQVTTKDGVTTLTYTDGEQYSIYTFKQAALDAVVAGKVDKIPGTYEDGFDWANGYNVRARFAIECTR